MTEQQFIRRVPDFGDIICNDVQKLVKQGVSALLRSYRPAPVHATLSQTS